MNKPFPFAVLVKENLAGADAFWLYQGEPRAEVPHALLTSGNHSDGFVNVGQVLKEAPGVRIAFAYAMRDTLNAVWQGRIYGVVGADTSSTLLAGDLAIILNAEHIRMRKTEDEQGKRQVWDDNNAPLPGGVLILHIEELITTAFSAEAVRKGIRQAHPGTPIKFVPYLPVVVDRSDPENRVAVVEDSAVLSLLQLAIRNYDTVNCPYCAAGSQAIKPKEGDNWLRLTGKAA